MATESPPALAGYVSQQTDITNAEFGHAWRDGGNGTHAVVHLNWHLSLYFDTAATARAVAAACTEAAEALDKLERRHHPEPCTMAHCPVHKPPAAPSNRTDGSVHDGGEL